MDRHVHLGVDRAEFVDRFTKHIQHAAEGLTTYWNGDHCAGIDGLHAADHALGGDHRDAANAAFAEMLLHLNDDVEWRRHNEALAHDAQRLEDRRHVRLFKLNVNGRAADADYFTDVLCLCHKSLS